MCGCEGKGGCGCEGKGVSGCGCEGKGVCECEGKGVCMMVKLRFGRTREGVVGVFKVRV